MQANASAKAFRHRQHTCAFRSFAAIAYLLAIFMTSASCLHAVAHPQAMCSHCAHQMPLNQETPPCCNASHHPQALLVPVEFHLPALLPAIVSAVPALTLVPGASIPVQALEIPPLPPLIALRI